LTPTEIELMGARIRGLLADAREHQAAGHTTQARAAIESAAADFQLIQSQTHGGHPFEPLGSDLWDALQTSGFDVQEIERLLSAPGVPASRWKRKDKEEKGDISGLRPGGSPHHVNPRGSTREPHEYGEAGKQRSFGGEKGDENRNYPRKRPLDHPRGPWPPKYVPISPPTTEVAHLPSDSMSGGYDQAQQDYEQAAYHELGRGVKEDPERAFVLYLQAAEAQHSGGQGEVARCYYWGIGTDKDYQAAVKWYRMAAERGDADSQYALGCMFEYGEGVQPDRALAVLWYKRASAQGNDQAQESVARLEST
jgi:TPR repeat protein